MRRVLPFALSTLACVQVACSNSNDDDPTRSSAAALCDDGNSCTFDSYTFVGGVFGCQHVPVAAGTTCSSLTLCGASGTCDASGTCIASEPVCDDGNDCTSDICLSTYLGGMCTHTTAPLGTTCDDDSACTVNDLCSFTGTCTGTAVSADDDNPCTADSCDPVTGVQHTPVADGSSCEDGNPCNGNETCASGSCESGAAPDFDDENPCTTDSCDPVTGEQHTPVVDGTSCVDDDLCNGNEVCTSGVCQSGTALDCDDDNVCTTDSCYPDFGCHHNVTVCTDGSACTVDLCDPVLGCTSTPISCDDNDACTTDSCDDVAGCQYQAVNCSDGDLCTIDACDSATGCSYTPKDCNDANVCTSDACDSQTGNCQYQALVNDPCNDNDLCTTGDRCDAVGSCGGDAVDTDDANPCTADSCDSMSGITHAPVDPWTACSDGDPSNGSEVCDANAVCVSLPQSTPVVELDPDVDERQLGEGRHPVAASESGLATAFYEVLSTGAGRVGVATFSPLGEGLGVWRDDTSILEPDPVVAALPSGGFVVAYHDLFVDGDGLGVVLVRLDANGQQVGSATIANQTTDFGQHSPDLIWQGDRLWVAWEDDSVLATIGRRVCQRPFSATLVAMSKEDCDGAIGETQGRVSWSPALGNPARAWRSESGGAGSIEVSWNNTLWSLPLTGLPPSTEVPTMAALDATHLLVVHTVGMGDQALTILEQGGAMIGPTVINPFPAGARFEPSLAVTDDGVFLAWREDAGLDLEDTFFQKLTWDGAALTEGDTWALPHDAVYVVGDQRRPALSGVPGALWAAWNDLQQGYLPKHGDVRVSFMPTPIDRPEPVE